jgi:hypothetical protein
MEVLLELPMPSRMVERCASVFWLVRSRCYEVHVLMMGNGSRKSIDLVIVVMASIVEILFQSFVHGFVNAVDGLRLLVV